MTWNDNYTTCLVYGIIICVLVWAIIRTYKDIRNPKRDIDMQMDMGKPSRTNPKWFPWFYLVAAVLSLALVLYLFAGMLILHFFHHDILK